MPLYEYKCAKCGQRTERIEKVIGPHLRKCPKCGGHAERMASAPAIQFKGSGWYVTDYAKSSSSGDKKAAEGSGESGKASEKNQGKNEGQSEGKSDSKSAEKAPAAKDKKAAAKNK